MKKYFLICLASTALSVSAFASTHKASVETVAMSVDLEISKCELAPGTVSCDSAASLGENIEIQLSECTTSNGGTTCEGTWTGTKSRDDYQFDGSITVSKTVYSDGSSYYSLRSSVGPTLNSNSIPHSYIEMYLMNGKVTDGVRFSSAPLKIAKDSGSATTYTPSLLITPSRP